MISTPIAIRERQEEPGAGLALPLPPSTLEELQLLVGGADAAVRDMRLRYGMLGLGSTVPLATGGDAMVRLKDHAPGRKEAFEGSRDFLQAVASGKNAMAVDAPQVQDAVRELLGTLDIVPFGDSSPVS